VWLLKTGLTGFHPLYKDHPTIKTTFFTVPKVGLIARFYFTLFKIRYLLGVCWKFFLKKNLVTHNKKIKMYTVNFQLRSETAELHVRKKTTPTVFLLQIGKDHETEKGILTERGVSTGIEKVGTGRETKGTQGAAERGPTTTGMAKRDNIRTEGGYMTKGGTVTLSRIVDMIEIGIKS
jgi:hypothetical protein